jgi:CxxC motif-containing protein (DUF1111 family)
MIRKRREANMNSIRLSGEILLGVGILAFPAAALAALGDPLPGLSGPQMEQFRNGKATFVKVDQVVADGLGPVFNDVACANCHANPPGGSNGRLETRFGKMSANVFDPLANEGGSLQQDHAIGAASAYLPNANVPNPPAMCQRLVFAPEVVPPDADVVASRRTTPLFGLGFVDALVPNALHALAAHEAWNDPLTAGTVSMVLNPDNGKMEEGKFGWKAQVSALHVFAGDAYLNEMGITSPSFPKENCPQGNCDILACNPFPGLNDDGTDINAFTQYMTMLDAPPRGPITSQVREGALLFDAIGCTSCHTETLQTGPSPIAALNNRTFHPYSDFLLHDMGQLGDGITQNNATGNLMRTAPLWGVRYQVKNGLLHDGSAHTLTDAISAHDGQAFFAAESFLILDPFSQQDILAFLNSL